jgi:replicative DNA helicase
MDKYKRGLYDADMIKYNLAFGELSNIPLYIYDDTDCTNKVEGIIPFIRNVKKKHGIEFYFIDYIQKIKSTGTYNSRNYELEYISNALSVLTKIIKVHISAFSQLSKAVESRGGTKRPNMSDIRDSGAIEQDGFNIGMLYRPEYYEIEEDKEGNSTKGLLEIIWVKGRVFGKTGSSQLIFNDDTKSYEDIKYDAFGGFHEIEPPELVEEKTNGNQYNGMITSHAKMNDDEDVPF